MTPTDQKKRRKYVRAVGPRLRTLLFVVLGTAMPRWWRGLAAIKLADALCQRGPAVREGAGEHFVENHSKSVDIAAGVDLGRSPEDLLRCSVGYGADELAAGAPA